MQRLKSTKNLIGHFFFFTHSLSLLICKYVRAKRPCFSMKSKKANPTSKYSHRTSQKDRISPWPSCTSSTVMWRLLKSPKHIVWPKTIESNRLASQYHVSRYISDRISNDWIWPHNRIMANHFSCCCRCRIKANPISRRHFPKHNRSTQTVFGCKRMAPIDAIRIQLFELATRQHAKMYVTPSCTFCIYIFSHIQS